MPTFNLRDATLKLRDGTGSPKTLTVKMGDGNFTYTETKERIYKMNRGRLDTVIDGDDVPVDIKFQGRWEFIKSNTGESVTIEDALKQTGEADDWVSSDTDTCAPYAVDILLEYTPICDASAIELLTFLDFRYEKLDHDAKAATIDVSGKANVTMPTSTRTAQT